MSKAWRANCVGPPYAIQNARSSTPVRRSPARAWHLGEREGEELALADGDLIGDVASPEIKAIAAVFSLQADAPVHRRDGVVRESVGDVHERSPR